MKKSQFKVTKIEEVKLRTVWVPSALASALGGPLHQPRGKEAGPTPELCDR